VIGEGLNTLKTYSKVTRYGLPSNIIITSEKSDDKLSPHHTLSDNDVDVSTTSTSAESDNREIRPHHHFTSHIEENSPRDTITARLQDVNLGPGGIGRLWVEREREAYFSLYRMQKQILTTSTSSYTGDDEHNFLRHTDLVLSDDIIKLLSKTHRLQTTTNSSPQTNGNGVISNNISHEEIILESESETESESESESDYIYQKQVDNEEEKEEEEEHKGQKEEKMDEEEEEEEENKRNSGSKKRTKNKMQKTYISDLQRMYQPNCLSLSPLITIFTLNTQTHTKERKRVSIISHTHPHSSLIDKMNTSLKSNVAIDIDRIRSRSTRNSTSWSKRTTLC
jgi:hypothetical protein